VRLRPAHHHGRQPAGTTGGSNHIRYAATDLVLRLTTDASITAIGEENPFFLEETIRTLVETKALAGEPRGLRAR